MNGERTLADFNVLIAASGPNRAVKKALSDVSVGSGVLDIQFVSKEGLAQINAIKVYAGPGNVPY